MAGLGGPWPSLSAFKCRVWPVISGQLFRWSRRCRPPCACSLSSIGLFADCRRRRRRTASCRARRSSSSCPTRRSCSAPRRRSSTSMPPRSCRTSIRSSTIRSSAASSATRAARPPEQRAALARLRRHRRSVRAHRHQQPRHRRRRPRSRWRLPTSASSTPRSCCSDEPHRPRRAAGSRTSSENLPALDFANSDELAGRRPGAGDRQSVRRRPDRDQRHRLGARAHRGRQSPTTSSSSRPMRRSIPATPAARWST